MGISTPSSYAEYITASTIAGFVWFGYNMYYGFDIVSSYCNVKDIAFAVHDLLSPVIQIAIAPHYVTKGLFESAVATGVQESGYIIATGIIVISILLTIMEINTSGEFKPSVWFTKLGRTVTTVYEYFGRFTSDLSSFYRILKLEKFIDAFFKLAYPVRRIIIAPVISTLKGYYTEVSKYRYGVFAVGFGTATLVILGSYQYLPQILGAFGTPPQLSMRLQSRLG
jgi:hypothetical protein